MLRRLYLREEVLAEDPILNLLERYIAILMYPLKDTFYQAENSCP